MNLLYETNYTLRVIKKKFGFSLLCVAVIAIGFMITLPLYSFVKNFGYTTLPYPDGDRLVAIKPYDELNQTEMGAGNLDAFQFNTYNDSISGFESVGTYRSEVIALSDGELAEQFLGYRTTANVLDYTAVAPILGRRLLPLDQVAGAEPVVLLGNDVWRNYYAGDPEIIGKSARVNGQPHTIVGVMPAGFSFPTVSDMWLPLSIPLAAEPGEGSSLTIIGLLKEGSSRSQVSEEVRSTSLRLAGEYPDHYRNRSAFVIRFTQTVINNGMFIFDTMGTVGFGLFLLICLNISNLLLIRANERVTELAIRAALGAKRIGLLAHVLMESFFICLAGAVIGIVCSSIILGGLDSFFSSSMEPVGGTPFWINFSFNRDELFLSISMLLILWLLSGLFAAWRGSHGDLNANLSSDSKNLAIEKGGRITKVFVHLQMCISFFLLLLSGVFLISFQSSTPESIVVNPQNYLIGQVSLDVVNHTQPAHSAPYRSDLRESLLNQSEISRFAFNAVRPGNATGGVRIALATDEAEISESPLFGINWVDENFFDVIEFPILEGRNFEATDNLQSPDVAIVDETFAQRLQLNTSPVGQSIQLYDINSEAIREVTIIGVVPQANNPDFTSSPSTGSRIYSPLDQDPTLSGFQFIARLDEAAASTPLAEIERTVRQVSSTINRDITLFRIMLLSEPIEVNISALRILLAMFASAALGVLALSVISIYGLISRSVLARTSEVGIRRAMGATNLGIVKIFVGQGFFYLAVALVIGGGLGTIAMNIAQSSLATVSGFNAMFVFTSIFSSVTAVISALVLVASYIPTRRLITLEPGEALHYE